ncbi:class I SAM-dependent methyltransferase [Streptomyces sp. ME19-01-6]|uniref:class I SAM-dependent methyltransferase n=1 Tax=Streptomyces sp. ME19-01-6 TaxID=3028686 RepID=UPI0029A9F61D|nr:class I SAM-dependent methyltransferase [Streptomyces sp. ME19-01-6]MDX3229514.1 class I SAM-dependent methyltransferase [Streptomyces sp. ME19-01-6]
MTDRGPTPEWLRLNRENWDDRVGVHAVSDFYDLPAFRAGGSTLRSFEHDEVGDVTGRKLLHLQCHMGQDTLSWARLGAETTGVDFSEPAIRTARTLAEDIQLSDRARFVVSDVYGAEAALRGQRFDIVYTGLGSLVWLPDLDRWAKIVASLLNPGGFLYLAEFHPFADTLGDDGRTVEQDYFDLRAQELEYPYTYTGGPALTHARQVQWHHPLGEVITALARADLRLDFLHERDVTLFPRFPVLERSGGEYRFPTGRPRVPLMYSLRATHAPS